MRKLIFTLLALCLVNAAIAQTIGIGTNTPDTSAQLDVYSTTKGFLPPRLALSAANLAAPVANPATGLLVYNTAAAGTAPFNVQPGYYFWNGSSWYPVVNKANAPGDMQYWNGTRWVIIPAGPNGAVLTMCNGIPAWGPCIVSPISLQPANNLFEGTIDGYFTSSPSSDGAIQFDIAAWTNGGNPQNRRVCIKFDYSILPAGAVVDSARLYLTSMPNPQNGNFIDAQFGATNAGYLQRITSAWTTPGQFSWLNQPATTAVNQVILPQSTSSNESSVLDVTQLVKDMLTNGNNGFFMRLQTEVTYNIRQYASSKYSDATKRPKLVIWFH
jgi:hypothetical protein